MSNPPPDFSFSNRIHCGDALEVLKTLPDECVQMCVTSPPYWGLRNYGVEGQIGLEPTPFEYVARMVGVFREVRRVLNNDGTLWLNLGDSYATGGGSVGRAPGGGDQGERFIRAGMIVTQPNRMPIDGLKPKDLVGIPWRLAFALQADGWYLRQDIIWAKGNCMPESVQDRCTKSHEYLFLLSKSQWYFFDHLSIQEPSSPESHARYRRGRSNSHKYADGGPGNQTLAKSFEHMIDQPEGPKDVLRDRSRDRASASTRMGREARWRESAPIIQYRNKRSVWTVNSSRLSETHFATFPPKLIEPCILAGSRQGDLVLDPFMGAGTTAVVAQNLGRKWLGIELNSEYVDMAKRRIARECAQMRMFC